MSFATRFAPSRERSVSPALTGAKRRRSSPPSPVFDLPPTRFIATASVVCASIEIEPCDIAPVERSEEHTSELQSLTNLVCRLLLEKKKKTHRITLAIGNTV